MLAVDRQERCAAVANGRHEQLTADDERFLVGEQNPLAGARCRERRTEARRTDNRREHRIDISQCCGFAQCCGAAFDARRRAIACDIARQHPRGVFVEQHRERRMKTATQRGELLRIAMSAQRSDGEAIGMLCDDVERGCTDRASRAEQR